MEHFEEKTIKSSRGGKNVLIQIEPKRMRLSCVGSSSLVMMLAKINVSQQSASHLMYRLHPATASEREINAVIVT